MQAALRNCRAGAVLLLTAMAVADCGGSSGTSFFGGPKQSQPAVQAVDPNAYPANYRRQIATYLMTQLTNRADYRNALIAAPMLKPVGQSQHYVVCLQFNGHNQHRDKVVIYLDGALQQYVDPTPEQCGDAAYQPFQELATESPG